MESLGDLKQSRVLSLSYRPESSHSVRIPSLSSARNLEINTRLRSLTSKNSIDQSIHSATFGLDDCPSFKSQSYRSIVQDQSHLSIPINPTSRSNDKIVSEDTSGRIIRPLQRTANVDANYWHVAGIPEGRSKSFVLPDRCSRRSHPVGIKQSTNCRPTPLTAAVIAPSSFSNSSSIQHHHYHHRHQPHHHYHQPHQDQTSQQQQLQCLPLSSSSTSSSFSSTDHIMPPPSPTTPSVITAQTSASLVRSCHIVDK